MSSEVCGQLLRHSFLDLGGGPGFVNTEQYIKNLCRSPKIWGNTNWTLFSVRKTYPRWGGRMSVTDDSALVLESKKNMNLKTFLSELFFSGSLEIYGVVSRHTLCLFGLF